jgi:hypothetical protein
MPRPRIYESGAARTAAWRQRRADAEAARRERLQSDPETRRQAIAENLRMAGKLLSRVQREALALHVPGAGAMGASLNEMVREVDWLAEQIGRS